MIDFNDLLLRANIDPKTTLVLRHRPKEPKLRKVLPWLASEQPDVYNAYQQTQTPKVKKQMLRATHVASFIGDRVGAALFVGLYENRDHWKVTKADRIKIRANCELWKYGAIEGSEDNTWFDLVLTDHFRDWSGRLIIHWPPPEISWSRWSAKNEFLIEAILEESLLSPDMPNWRELTLTWDELQVIPASWKNALSQWRGIYLILDTSDGKAYVGAAYGKDNLLGRWLGYSKTGHGGNKQLKKRNASNFRFTILERVSPDMKADDVIRREASWKTRLHTREFGLNEN